jgi:spoIIIJ-associated protein
MRRVTAVGKSVEDAIRNGLTQLNATREEVEVSVLEQPSKGLFGLIGVRDAKVELVLLEKLQEAETNAVAAEIPVSSEDDPISETMDFLAEVFDAMDIEVEMSKKVEKEIVTISMKGNEIGMLIGRRGQTLDALQYLTNIVFNRKGKTYTKIVLDAENFRDRRRQTLEELAERLARKVVKTRKDVVLEPMSPQERKIIHSTLQDHPSVKTFSKGEDPNRRIVITLK